MVGRLWQDLHGRGATVGCVLGRVAATQLGRWLVWDGSMLREGDWQGQQLIDADAVKQVLHAMRVRRGNCGIGWWNNNGGRVPRAA